MARRLIVFDDADSCKPWSPFKFREWNVYLRGRYTDCMLDNMLESRCPPGNDCEGCKYNTEPKAITLLVLVENPTPKPSDETARQAEYNNIRKQMEELYIRYQELRNG